MVMLRKESLNLRHLKTIQVRMYFAGGAMISAIGVLILLSPQFQYAISSGRFGAGFGEFIGVGTVILGMMFVAFGYLQSGGSSSFLGIENAHLQGQIANSQAEIEELRFDLANIRNRLDSKVSIDVGANNPESDEKESARDNLNIPNEVANKGEQRTDSNDATNDHAKDGRDDQVSYLLDPDDYVITYSKRVESGTLASNLVQRMNREVADMRLRANINLILGMTITGFGLYLLWTTVAMVDSSDLLKKLADEDGVSYSKFFKNLVLPLAPKYMLVIFIEIFAYFFLRLYKTGLEDIKYFQNELTNLESKFIALQVAIMEKNPTALKSTIDVLSKTERNFILTKGQSTVELERAKNESDFAKEILKYIPKIVGEKTKAKSE